MRIWRRSPIATCCTACRTFIAPGDPLLELRLAGVRRVLRRCTTCAGEPVPEDLPVLPEPETLVRQANPLPMMRFTADMLPLDFKQRAAREPGEEG